MILQERQELVLKQLPSAQGLPHLWLRDWIALDHFYEGLEAVFAALALHKNVRPSNAFDCANTLFPKEELSLQYT